MSDTKLIVTKDKLDKLATSISTKSGVATPMTIAQMKAAVDNIAGGTIYQDENGYLVLSEGGNTDNVYKLAAGTITDADVNWEAITSLRESAFLKCTALTSVDNLVLNDFTHNIFSGCSNIATVDITVKNFNQAYCGNMLRYCTSLTTATFHFIYSGTSNVLLQSNYFLADDTALTTVIFDVPNASSMSLNAAWMFYNSNALRNIVLKANFVVGLIGGTNANGLGGIYNNPLESKIYVPQSLISQYQQASNWSSLYSSGVSFVAIEGSQYET